MIDKEIMSAIDTFLGALQAQGTPVVYGVLFGSHAYGRPDEWSDIDLVVVSPALDGGQQRKYRTLLRRVARETGQRIEAIPCSEQQWVVDDVDPIIEMARRHGIFMLPPNDPKALTPQFHEAIVSAKRQELTARRRWRALAEGRESYVGKKM